MEEPEVHKRFGTHSPEFEFWMVRNPYSFPQPGLSSADELFSHGILLPVHPFNQSCIPELESSGSAQPVLGPDDSDPRPHKTELDELSGSGKSEFKSGGPEVTAGEFTGSKRWKDIFKSSKDESNKAEKKTKKKEKKCGGVVGGSNGVSTAELKINIWPFSRSRSAGNGGSSRQRVVTRKVNSAPCSRSNSAGDQSRNKSPSSLSRSGGVYLGRSSPVWQVRRGSEGHRKVSDGSRSARVLKLNVPMCIGYRQNSVCRSDENSSMGGGVAGGGAMTSEGVRSFRSNSLFNLRSIFATKKVVH